MKAVVSQELTTLLVRWSNGDAHALDELAPLVYAELRKLARRHLRGEHEAYTLQSTELVHEAFLRLFEWQNIHWRNRAQFFALAAQIMRNILVDRARERLAIKRGSGAVRVTLVESAAIAPDPPLDLIALDNALNKLHQLNPEQARVVELRFFGGLSIQETAQVLAISPTTAKRLWTVARGWLYRELTARK